jgi:hypothetical protein
MFRSPKNEPSMICLSVVRASHTHINVSWGFILCCTPPTQGTVDQPHYVELSFQGVESGNEASSCILFKGLKPRLSSGTRAAGSILEPVPECWSNTDEVAIFGTMISNARQMFLCLTNLLKSTGHVMYHQFNIQQLYALPTMYLSENKQRLVPLTA